MDLTFVHGFTAVRLFFIVSGFYMAMILNGKYSKYSSFIVNRALKLFPAYWVVLILCFIYSGSKLSGLHDFWWFYYFFSNVFMIGSHFTSAIIERGGELMILPFGSSITVPEMTWKYLYIGPIWSLSIEILFYLVAPFLLTRRNFNSKMALMLLISVASCAFLISTNSWRVPWMYNFLAPSFYLFMLGAIAWRFYDSPLFKQIHGNGIAYILLALIIAYIVFYQFLPAQINLRLINITLDPVSIGILLFTVSIPFVFELSKSSKIDAFFGSLSYPMYISHFFIIFYFPYFKQWHPLIGTIILSLILEFSLMKLVDRYRIKLVK